MDPHRKAIIHGSSQSGHRTPPEMASKLTAFFGCTIDLAATQETNVLGVLGSWLGPDQGHEHLRNAQAVDWHKLKGHKVGFLNPPFSLEEIKELREVAEHREIPDLEARINALRIEMWAWKACEEAMKGFQTIGVFPYSPQTEWFKQYVLGIAEGEDGTPSYWGGGAYEYWVIPYRVSFLAPDGSKQGNAGVNTCVVNWKPNPGFYGNWPPPIRYWSYR